MKILLADDHKMMRDGLRAIIDKAAEHEVVGEAADGREAVALAHRLRPQIVVMDVSMPELNGIDATRRIVGELPGTRVIALSMNADRRYVQAMFRAGAVGYLIKNGASEELLQALRVVAEDQMYLSPSIASVLVSDYIASLAPAAEDRPLTPREREVLQLLAEGHTSKNIASRLNLALPTVETHRRQIMTKLGLHSIAELTKYAIREGLTSLI